MTAGFDRAEITRRLEVARSEFARTLGLREDVFIEQTADSIDQAQDAQVRDMAVRNLDHSMNNLRRVELALRRLAGDEYGICEDCEQPIAAKRLYAVPWAHLCIHCQEIADGRGYAAGSDYGGLRRSVADGESDGLTWNQPETLTAA